MRWVSIAALRVHLNSADIKQIMMTPRRTSSPFLPTSAYLLNTTSRLDGTRLAWRCSN